MPLAAVFSALGDDPEIASFYELTGRLQRDGYRIVVDTLGRKRPLRTGLSLAAGGATRIELDARLDYEGDNQQDDQNNSKQPESCSQPVAV